MKEQLKESIVHHINVWDDTDIYAISLFVYDDGDNPCKPTVTLGYNTENQVQAELDRGFASDEEEARWNYAFWIQNEFFRFGTDETAEIVQKWIIDHNLPFYDDGDDAWNHDKTFTETAKITKHFVSLLVDIVKEIHAQKILTQKFGRELPILIHELEYYDQIAEQNIEANGEALVKEFAEWCMWG